MADCHALFLFDPLPDLPPRGKEYKQSFSPLGETGKGVIKLKRRLINRRYNYE